MGSVYAGLLGAAGNDVTAVDVNGEHVEAIRQRGLRVSGASGERVVQMAATTRPAAVGVVELVVIATKAMDARVAAGSAEPLIGPQTTVLTIQNGLGAADAVAEVVDERQLVVGVAGGFGASLVEPGHAHHHGMELVRLGERTGPAGARCERIADVWRAAGFTVKTYDDVSRLLWEKLICNACYAGVCGLLELTIGEVVESPHAWAIASRCAQEALDVGRACGVDLEIADCCRLRPRLRPGDPGRAPVAPARPARRPTDRGRVDQRLRPARGRQGRRRGSDERPDHLARAREADSRAPLTTGLSRSGRRSRSGSTPGRAGRR